MAFHQRAAAGCEIKYVRADPCRRASGDDSIEYRCYERGVYRETLACGTGAVAVAYVVKQYLGYESRGIRVLPHRCRWYKPDAVMAVNNGPEGWVLEGQPDIVAEIEFRFEPRHGEIDYLLRQQVRGL